jgi:predicted nucleic acid-binding protein
VILVDTSVWVDHLRREDPLLISLLERSEVFVHSWVVGELALGNMHNRDEVLALLGDMPQAQVIDHDAVRVLIADEKLYGLGIGLVDVHLLASASATPGTLLWTRDRRLGEVAGRLALRFGEAPDVPASET